MVATHGRHQFDRGPAAGVWWEVGCVHHQLDRGSHAGVDRRCVSGWKVCGWKVSEWLEGV